MESAVVRKQLPLLRRAPLTRYPQPVDGAMILIPTLNDLGRHPIAMIVCSLEESTSAMLFFHSYLASQRKREGPWHQMIDLLESWIV